MQPCHVSFWLRQPPPQAEPLRVTLARAAPEWQMESSSVVIASNDPLVAYLLGVAVAVNIEQLQLDSPELHALQEASVKLAVPLLSQGELVGLLQLGPRKSDQDYSSDDRRLLHALAIQAAPAIRVAQLVREQRAQARERERLEQELRIARKIQQAFLPKDLPELAGWQVATYYQPARAVGGDFYDFLVFADGSLAIVIGDVSGKGIPAALLMTTTRTILRSVAQREASPGQVLEQRQDLAWPHAVLGRAAERQGDVKSALGRYLAGLDALGTTSTFTDGWTLPPVRGGFKYAAQRAIALLSTDSASQPARLNSYVQHLFTGKIRDFWLNRGDRFMAEGRFAEAYRSYYAAGWDDFYTNDMVIIVDRITDAAKRAGWEGRYRVAMQHLETLK
jgi:hypothetical protein